MKKSLLALAVLAGISMLFMGCPSGTDAEPTSDPKVNTPVETAKPFTISYKSNAQWAAPTFEVAGDWVSLEVKFADGADLSKNQFCVISDKVEKEESWGTQYFSKYPKADATTKIVFADWLVKNDEENGAEVADSSLKAKGATKITKCSIQNMTKDSFELKVKSAKATKADGTVEDVVPAGDWGSSVTE